MLLVLDFVRGVFRRGDAMLGLRCCMMTAVSPKTICASSFLE